MVSLVLVKHRSESVAINTLSKIVTNRSIQEEIIEIIKNAGGFYQSVKDILSK
jgi:hypothetical protein